jgi:pimeloyl-ACP methyl ester carboxylesterase
MAFRSGRLHGMRGLCTSVLLLIGFVVACGGGASPPSAPRAPAAHLEGTVPSADGVPIYYRSVSSGEPAVVLVHCWGGSSDEWTDSIPPLAATHRVIALDLAGHGRSGKGRSSWTVPSFVADIRAVLDHLGVARAILVGHSMSGPITIEAAVEMPDRVLGVVPIDTLQDVGKPAETEEDAKFFAAMRTSFAPTVEKLIRTLVPKSADPKVIARILAFELANDPAIAIPILENNWRFPTKDAFAKVKVPIIAINANLFPTNTEGNRALAPQFEVRLIEGVGHWPMLEAPERFNVLLTRAVADITAAPAAK